MTVKIFIGVDANGHDAESAAVLEWSIRKHASEDVDIVWMMQSRDPDSFWAGWNTEKWATPFSCFRFGISAYCGFQGRAIYMDSDVIVRADIAELFHQDMHGKAVLGKGNGSPRLCVSLWDCAAAKEHLDALYILRSDPDAHKRMSLKFRSTDIVGSFDGDWNCLDGTGYADINDPAIKAIHYTAIATQLQLKHAVPRLAKVGQRHWFDGEMAKHSRQDLQALFDELLIEAARNDYAVSDYIPDVPFGEYRKQSLVNYRRRA